MGIWPTPTKNYHGHTLGDYLTISLSILRGTRICDFSLSTKKTRMGTQYKEDVPSSNYGGGAPMGGYVE
jgi:hypothetical protein